LGISRGITGRRTVSTPIGGATSSRPAAARSEIGGALGLERHLSVGSVPAV
jgi:hypothetical protein